MIKKEYELGIETQDGVGELSFSAERQHYHVCFAKGFAFREKAASVVV